MKKKYLLLSLIGTTFTLNAQFITKQLEGNNVNATISNKWSLFNSPENSSGYEWPKGSTNHLIYGMSFWFGAKTSSGELAIAADIMPYSDEEYRDIYPGALKADGTAEAPIPAYADDIYVVSKAEIEYHVSNIYTPGYVIPHGILNWPAHGDVALGMAYSLAPFADLNGNGVYEPEIGEYPEIRGDHAAYMIMNDMAGPHGNSGGAPLGIEIHFMFYQYETEDDINNTTFINVRVINRGTQSYPEFIIANYVDFDIGTWANDDDFAGCDSASNLIFCYNGDLFDEGGDGAIGYGEFPPAVGLLALNHTMRAGGSINHGPYADPVHYSDYWDIMNGHTYPGVDYVHGVSGLPTKYLFSGDPRLPISDTNWIQVGSGVPPGDKRCYMASEAVSFESGQVLCYDYAVIVGQIDEPSLVTDNVGRVIDMVPEIKAFYDEQPDTYCEFTLGLEEQVDSPGTILVYPNPSEGDFSVDMEGNFNLKLFSLDGRLVYEEVNLEGRTIIHTNLSQGTYLVLITQNNKTYQSKIVIRN